MKKYFAYLFYASVILIIFIKLYAALYTIYAPDLIFYQNWAYVGANFGIDKIYSVINQPYFSPPNYPPVIPIIISALASIYSLFCGSLTIGDPWFIYTLKLLPISFDILCAYAIYKIVIELGFKEKAKLASLIFLISPANLVVSSLWGQTDSVLTFFMLLSTYSLLKSKWKSAWVLFGISIAIKQQAIMMLPILIAISIKKIGIKNSLPKMVLALSIIFVIFVPYILNGSASIALQKILESGRSAPVISANAFNVWWILFGEKSFLTSDLVWPLSTGIVAITMVYYFIIKNSLKKLAKDKGIVIYAVFMCLFAFFMLPTQVHERYLYYALPFLLIYSMLEKRLFKYYVILQITFFLNLISIFPNPASDFITRPIALVNAIVFILCFKYLADKTSRGAE